MKLKTKFQDEDFDLGEVVGANIYYGGYNRIKLIATAAKGGEYTFYFESLKELNEMFEDYKEPKKYYYINDIGAVQREDVGKDVIDEIARKEIGNYFETEEEAEKAVEKLEAWKRLKDKCFRFYRWNKGSLLKSLPNTIEFACDDTEMWTWEDIQDDLDLLFSGGEE